MKGLIIKLYRGFTNLPNINTIIKTRKNRKPSNLDFKLHYEIDNYFFKRFGIKFRSQSVFCTGDIETAKAYGKVAEIKPIGDFEVCWSPKCFDMFEIEDYPKMDIEEFIIRNEYQIGNLEEAIKSGNEIMLYCDSYKVVAHE